MGLSDQEQQLLQRIVVASDNDPERPEFPPEQPKFPATPTYQVQVPGFTNVWLKDESHNPTGTHKDRLAWEIVVSYREFLLAKERSQRTSPLPSMSVISSGSTAIAVQCMLRRYNLPNLKVLLDYKADVELIEQLKSIGCEVYTTDLSRRVLGWRDILKLTNNTDGFDITSSEALDPTTRFYDWLSYEILNESPDYCFVPFGTGNLFENILNIAKREALSDVPDPRFRGDIQRVRNCHFMGATTSNPETVAEKLYSPHLPFSHFDEQWIRFYRYAGFCGEYSGVSQVQERSLGEAHAILSDQGVVCEHSAVAGLALMLQEAERLPRDRKMLVVSTGKARVL